MKLRTLAVGVAAAGIFALAAGPASAAHDEATTTVALNGANEVPEKGDPNGSGKIGITVFGPRAANGTTVAFDRVYYLCYDLVTRNIADPTGAHIHEVERAEGQEGANPRKLTGGVVVNLFSTDVAYKDADGRLTDAANADSTCVTTEDPADHEVIDEMVDDPAEYYVNIHNPEFPSGAIRGQVNFDT